jgi:hypothetical protein
VTCYVDPSNPTAAVIERHLSPQHLVVGAIFCAIFTFAPVMALSLWVASRRRARAQG